MEQHENYITSKEAADFLSLKIGTFRNYVSRGAIPYHESPTGSKRYLKSELRKFMGVAQFAKNTVFSQIFDN